MLNSLDIARTHFPRLSKTPIVGKGFIAFLRALFHESEYQDFCAKYPHLKGLDFVEQVLEHFDFTYTVHDKELSNIPSQGRVVIFANHPIGTLDGLVLIKLLSNIRKDIKVVSNDVLLSVTQLEHLLLPVNNLKWNTARDKIKDLHRHLEAEGAIIIFPAGSVSRKPHPKGIRDEAWRSGFLKIAKKTQSPLLPIHINARNSWFFYALSIFAKPFSTLLLVREMYKHQGNVIDLRIGKSISPESYQSLPVNEKTTIKLLRKHLYRLNNKKNLIFETQTTIASAENRSHLYQEIKQGTLLREMNDGIQIYLLPYRADSSLMREIGRLRELSFRMVGEGTGKRRDIDCYDENYEHIVLWNRDDMEVAGAYRIANAADIIARKGVKGLYSASLFKYQQPSMDILKQGLELGRSFVQPKYWGKRSLDYLWYGIGAYLAQNPQYKYLFGPVSLSNNYPTLAKELLVFFYSHYFPAQKFTQQDEDAYSAKDSTKNLARAHHPFIFDATHLEHIQSLFQLDDYQKDLNMLRSQLQHLEVKIPTLYKQYSELTSANGCEFWSFSIDPDFANCIDGLIVVDIEQIKDKKKHRYMSFDKELNQTSTSAQKDSNIKSDIDSDTHSSPLIN